MRRIRLAVLSATAVIVAFGAALTACGGDAVPDALTEAEFVEQANALCTTENQAIGEALGPLFAGGQPSREEQQAALDQIVVLSRSLADDIDALAEPGSLTDDVEQLVAALDDGTDGAAAQTGSAYFASDEDPWSAAAARARDMGLDACSAQGE